MNLLSLSSDCVNLAADRMRTVLNEKRNAGTLSTAHDNRHCGNVSLAASAIARELAAALGVDPDMAEALAHIAGSYHDIARESTETTPHGPASADVFWTNWSQGKLPGLSAEQAAIVHRAITLHEESFGDIRKTVADPLEALGEWWMEAIVVHSLKAADAVIEASGWRVVARRCLFVGRERMLTGDLSEIFSFPGESPLAVIGESLRRLYGKLPLPSLPLWIRPYGEILHSKQYLFLAGLLAEKGLNEISAARLMLDRFPKFSNDLFRVVVDQHHLFGKHFSVEEYPVLHREIARIAEVTGDYIQRKKLVQASSAVCLAIAITGNIDGACDAISDFGITDNPFLDEMVNGITSSSSMGQTLLVKIREEVRNGIEQVRAPVTT